MNFFLPSLPPSIGFNPEIPHSGEHRHLRNGAPTNTSKIGEDIYTRTSLEGIQGTGCNRTLTPSEAQL